MQTLLVDWAKSPPYPASERGTAAQGRGVATPANDDSAIFAASPGERGPGHGFATIPSDPIATWR